MPTMTRDEHIELQRMIAQLRHPEVVAFYILYLNTTLTLRQSRGLTEANPIIHDQIMRGNIDAFIQDHFHVSADVAQYFGRVIRFAPESLLIKISLLLTVQYRTLTRETVLPWFTRVDFARHLLTQSHPSNPSALPLDVLQTALVSKGIYDIRDILRQIESMHATGEIVRRDERIQVSVEKNGWYKVICFANRPEGKYLPAETRVGSSKTIRLDVIVVWIRPFPGMQFFTSTQGFQTCYFGLPYASLSRKSSVFTQGARVDEQERVKERLIQEGFIPFDKYSKMTRGRTHPTFLIPYMGDNLSVLINRGAVFDRRFIEKLLQRALELGIANDFAVHDIKPSNILYDARTDKIEFIDWQQEDLTPAFVHYPSHLEDAALILNDFADTLMHTIVFLLNDNTELARQIFMAFLHNQSATNAVFRAHRYARELIRVCDHISHYAVLHPEYIHPAVRRLRPAAAAAAASCADRTTASQPRFSGWDGFGEHVDDGSFCKRVDDGFCAHVADDGSVCERVDDGFGAHVAGDGRVCERVDDGFGSHVASDHSV